MPKMLARSKKKVSAKKTTKKPAMKKKTKKIMGKKKLVKKVAKKVTKKLTRSVMAKAKGPPVVGKVVHYYDKIGVAVLELKAPVSIGDFLTFRRGELAFTQPVVSLQIDRQPVAKAKKGQAVGMKVNTPAERGTTVERA